jgi:hypothetical protein
LFFETTPPQPLPTWSNRASVIQISFFQPKETVYSNPIRARHLGAETKNPNIFNKNWRGKSRRKVIFENPGLACLQLLLSYLLVWSIKKIDQV